MLKTQQTSNKKKEEGIKMEVEINKWKTKK